MVGNLEQVLEELRTNLPKYLETRVKDWAGLGKKFRCFVHDDHDASMCLNPKQNNQVAHCFSCNATVDLFGAAHYLEGYPLNGPDWIRETVIPLAEKFGVKVQVEESSLTDQERSKLFRLAQDITDVLVQAGDTSGYADQRNWHQEHIWFGSIAEEALIEQLVRKGWSAQDVVSSLMVRNNHQSFFGADKLTFVIKDERGRPVGFQYRNLTDKGPKYVNTPETLIYTKGKVLLGLDSALQEARRTCLVIVEGNGDLAQLRRVGVQNSAATCGTALTTQHLLMLRSMGIRSIKLCLDWDTAGITATSNIFFNTLKEVPGMSVSVINPPAKKKFKDVDEMLVKAKDAQAFLDLESVPAFTWAIQHLSDNMDPAEICSKMVALIAIEPAAVKREMLVKQLSQETGISFTSIRSDVDVIRSGSHKERKERLLAEVSQYCKEVEQDPDNITSIQGQHEDRISKIEQEFNRNQIGVQYQLQRFDAIQQQRAASADSDTGFKMGWFSDFEYAMSGSMPWSTGCLMYAGGRGNSGKTAVCITIGTDIALHDPDAIVGFHFTDDSYDQTEPRIKSALARMLYPDFPRLSIGQIVNPKTKLQGFEPAYLKALQDTDDLFKQLLSEERMFIMDSEDGTSTSALEKNVRHYRHFYPSKKLFLVCDNTHNYTDFYNLDQTQRITQIANTQKIMTTKYHCCMLATAEYRKNTPKDPRKLVWPVDDDLADARALIYRPNVIFHVYNDIHDRGEHAEIFWQDKGEPCPRLILNFTKNKISSFKGQLALDLDPRSVTLKQVAEGKALREAESYSEAKDAGTASIEDGKVHWVDTEYDGDDNA